MKDGFIKTIAATPIVRVADVKTNCESIKREIDKATAIEAKLLVLPELCVCGYTCGDLFFNTVLVEESMKAVLEIALYTAGKKLVAIVGTPVSCGNMLYNCAAVLFNGRIIGVVPKTNLPNYNEFYEKRHFSCAPKCTPHEIDFCGEKVLFGTDIIFTCAELCDFKFSVEICEDMWVPNPPSVRHSMAGANIIVNISASNETVGKADYRRSLVKGLSASLVAGYVFASAGEGESTTDVVFSSQNMIAENGVMLAEAPLFENSAAVSEIDVQKLSFERRKIGSYPDNVADGYAFVTFHLETSVTLLTRTIDPCPFIPSDKNLRDKRCEEILLIQAHGLKKRISHVHARSVIVGISGGLDSCLALLVSVKAMDLLGRTRKDVVALTMPCFGTTERTRNNAVRLCNLLGVTLREIDITQAVNQHFTDIGHDPSVYDVTFENSQARERTQILMDAANQHGGFVVGTGDLSELALGWATYNGDHMSMYGVNASVPKTLIRYIIDFFAESVDNKELSSVLSDILDTPVSPELLPSDGKNISQVTEDLVGPYELHDFFLYYGIRWGFRPAKVYRLAVSALGEKYGCEVIKKWLHTFYRRFFAQQYKRSCLPDGPKVGSVSLSPRGDFRMPSDACADIWLAEIDTIRV